jgi:hypothetical protein
MPNGGDGGLGSDCSGALGGDGSIGRYCGGSVTALGLLLQGDDAPTCRSPACWNPTWRCFAWRNTPISDEVVLDQVENCDRIPLKKQGFISQNHIGGFSTKREHTNTTHKHTIP